MLFTANGNIEIPTFPGAEIQCAALGTWDSATVTLQTFVDEAWRDVPDGAWNADFEIVRTNGDGSASRLVLTDAGASTSLSLNLTEISPK